jgi:hypothetical protein
MDLLRERLKARGSACAVLRGGGGDESSQSSTNETTNIDKRVAVQDGIGVTGDGNAVSYNSTDAVKAVAAMGADVIRSSGESVVDLYTQAGKTNADTWNTTITTGAKMIDRLIDKVGEGFSLSEKVVDSFQPSENKNTDAIKWAAIAAGVVGVTALWGKK